jgi:glycosyltransferase involved in cell wall biosynthesis
VLAVTASSSDHRATYVSKKIKLAIVSTHPIQYYAPVFRELAQMAGLDIRVFYTWSQTEAGEQHDEGFGRSVSWDVPLLDGYPYEFVPNQAQRPGSSHFFGINNPSLTRKVEAWHADAVLIFGWNLYSHLRAMRYFSGRIPVLFRGDSNVLAHSSVLKRIVRKGVLSWIYRYVDVAVAVGLNSRDYFLWCGIPPQNVLIAPHCVDNKRFESQDEEHELEAARWREKLGIAVDAVVILFAAKFVPVKRPKLLIDAFKSVPSAHLVLVGNGSLEMELRNLAGVSPRIHFLPFQNQSLMPIVYRLGDVFALPSLSETWGLALNEAMSCGRPVVASSTVGAARDLIDIGINGWTFASDQPRELTNVLQEAVSCGRERLLKMGELARQKIQNWSTQESARGIANAVGIAFRSARTDQAVDHQQSERVI